MQQFRPLQHPQFRELLAVEQFIDEVLALGRERGDQEPGVLFGGRQFADDVEVHAAHERGVVAHAARLDAELLQLVVDACVDVVRFDGRGPRELQVLGQRDERHADGERVEPGHDERLAALAGGHVAGAVDLGRVVVVGEEERERGHVAVGAVAVLRADHDALLLALAVEHGRRREHFHAHRQGDRGGVERGVGLEPADERLVVLVALLHPRAAGVRHLAERLLDECAFGRQCEVDAAAVEFAREAEVVAVGVEAEQRQAEPVLAAGGPVAPADVAPGPHEDGHHVLLERDRAVLLRLHHLHRHLDGLPAEGDRHLGGAVGDWQHDEFVEFRERGVGERHLRLRGHVAGDAVGLGELDDERLLVARRFEVDVRRVHGDRLGERFAAEGAEGGERKQVGKAHVEQPHAVGRSGCQFLGRRDFQ